jgi:phosphoribosyl 1,2-cyclic phosphodiesterase
MNIASIASGSNGNCYYIENDDDAVLIDAGVSTKQIVSRIANLGLKLDKIRGVFVTHEHIDHIRGLPVLTKKYQLPVYITQNTYLASSLQLKDSLLNFFDPSKMIPIGKLHVNPFLKNHDAAEPCSFTVSCGKKNVAVMTDIGVKCPNVISHLKDADAAFLESNYDDHMLATGPYPAHVKARISSDFGHLSNTQAAVLALEHASPRLKHVILSHLSGNNNTPELALHTFNYFIKGRKDLNINAILASRHKESNLIRL